MPSWISFMTLLYIVVRFNTLMLPDTEHLRQRAACFLSPSWPRQHFSMIYACRYYMLSKAAVTSLTRPLKLETVFDLRVDDIFIDIIFMRSCAAELERWRS